MLHSLHFDTPCLTRICGCSMGMPVGAAAADDAAVDAEFGVAENEFPLAFLLANDAATVATAAAAAADAPLGDRTGLKAAFDDTTEEILIANCSMVCLSSIGACNNGRNNRCCCCCK